MNQSTKHIAKAHDYFFRKMMSDIRVAREFFSTHLPQDILSATELDCLELQTGSHIDDLRQETIADILFKTKIAGREGYLYLLADHQSSPDELMPFRILKYSCNIIDQHIKGGKSNRIPLVVPFVVYHGKQEWNYSTDIADLVDAPKELIDQHFLKPFHLIDLTRIEDAALKQHIWSGVMELTLKYIFARDMLPHLKEIMGLLKQLEKTNGKSYAEIVLTYILDRGELGNKDIFLDLVRSELTPELGDKMMTIAEQLKAEGMQQGMQQGIEKGKLEVAERLLAQKIELALIAEVTGLSLQKIEELKKDH